MSDFDTWATKNNLGHNLDTPKVFHIDSQEIWKMPWVNDLLNVIEHNGNIDDFIADKNKKLHDAYIEEKQAPLKKQKSDLEAKIAITEDSLNQSRNIQKDLSEFEHDVQNLILAFPPEQQKNIKYMLADYYTTGTFDQEFSTKRLQQKPKNFFDKLLNGKKIKKNNETLDNFITKYKSKDLKSLIDTFPENENTSFISYNLKARFEAIIDLNNKKSADLHVDAQQYDNKLETQLQDFQKQSKQLSSHMDDFETSFSESQYLKKETALIHDFVQEKQDEILYPKSLNVEHYIEGLNSMNDDEQILLNIGLNDKGTEYAISNILKHNGLQSGTESQQWFIRKENINNGDNGKFEIFSPLLSVKEAKEIMPKLIDDLEKANFTSGLIVPIKAQDWFKTPNSQQDSLSQEQINHGLEKLILMAKIQEDKKNNVIRPYEKIMQHLEINSFDEMPKSCSSLDDLKDSFPKDQYLFSGSTASDDYTLLSARVGRNGIVYATPHLDYAAKYDGVTNVGSITGGTATGDKYVSETMGQAFGSDVKIGFINVYEQNPTDKYFGNFGMEDYLQNRKNIAEEKIYNVCEVQNGQMVPTQKQAQTAFNKILTKDQAINGYVGRSSDFTFNNQTYFPVSLDAETYVTPDKNPLKAKIMHMSWKDNSGVDHDYYMQVPEKTDEIMKYILNTRQADMKNTFNHNCRQDVLKRMETQKTEFYQGEHHQARSSDFIQKRQETLQKSLDNSNIKTEKTEDIDKNIPIGKLILQKQGILSSDGPRPVIKQNQAQNSFNMTKELFDNVR